MRNYPVTLIKLLFLLLMLLSAAFGYYEYYSGNLDLEKMRGGIVAAGPWGPAAFVGAYALIAGLGLPAFLASAVGALVFGKWMGTALNVTGAAIGASIAFGISRFVARDFVLSHIKRYAWYERFSGGVRKNGFYYVLFARLVPFLPFNGINFASGVTELTFRQFLFGTVVGIIPHTFVFANAVAETGNSITHGFTVTPGLLLAFGLFALFGIIPLAVKRVLERRREGGEE